MNHDELTTSRVGPPGWASKVCDRLEDLRGGQGETTGAGAAEEVALVAAGSVGRDGKLSSYTLRAVETSAEAAAKENRSPRDACPYRPDFAPREFEHWRAVFINAGGTW